MASTADLAEVALLCKALKDGGPLDNDPNLPLEEKEGRRLQSSNAPSPPEALALRAAAALDYRRLGRLC